MHEMNARMKLMQMMVRIEWYHQCYAITRSSLLARSVHVYVYVYSQMHTNADVHKHTRRICIHIIRHVRIRAHVNGCLRTYGVCMSICMMDVHATGQTDTGTKDLCASTNVHVSTHMHTYILQHIRSGKGTQIQVYSRSHFRMPDLSHKHTHQYISVHIQSVHTQKHRHVYLHI